jgi:hypothetical protein
MHLKEVAKLARGFADKFASGEWGRCDPAWRDLMLLLFSSSGANQ